MEITATFKKLKTEVEETSNEQKISDFYNKATEDYRFWSKDLNMHFGYYIPFKTSFLRRDSMLNQMNKYLFSLLELNNRRSHIADLGCGVGATMKYGINKNSKLAVTGFSISQFQVDFGNQYINSNRATILNKDYRKTEFSKNSFDGALAIESFCHTGCSKETLKEAYRILKPNSNLVIADAFTKKSRNRMNLFSKKVNDGLCKTWKLEKLGNILDVKENLESLGFKEVTIKNIWYRVAPSVLHVPFTIIGFIIKKLLKNKPLNEESIDNMKGSFYALLTSFCLQDFGYYVITAKK
ncbi:MAG: cyclopropane-fatty-acyl-phospholipid synthase family protein [Polaribacter sp.]